MLDWKELLDWTEYTKLFAGLLALVNPFGVVPIFAGLTEGFSQSEKNRISFVAALTVIIALSLFTFFGELILQFFGITIEAFQIAGGILLLLTGIAMLAEKPKKEEVHERTSLESSAMGITPLGIPLLAGPGALSTVIIYTHRHQSISHDVVLFLVAIAMGLLVYGVFKLGNVLVSLLGNTGIFVFNRVMGLLVAAMAVEFIVTGIGTHFPRLLR